MTTTLETALRSTAASLSHDLEAVFAQLVGLADVAAEILAGPHASRTALESLKPVVDKVIARLDGLVDSAGVSVVPGVLGDADSWHQWWSLVKGRLVFIPHNLNPSSINYYDYTNMTWFERPVASGDPELTGPYIDFGGADVKVITASRPVLRGKETVAVAGADLSLERIERLFLLGLGRRDEHIALITETRKIVASNSARFAPGTRYEGEREGPVPVTVPSLASPPWYLLATN